VDGTRISARLICDCYDLGGLGVPMGQMLCLLIDPSNDPPLSSLLLGAASPTSCTSAEQLDLMKRDRGLVRGALCVAEFGFPNEAVLVKRLIDQLVDDAQHDLCALPPARHRPSTSSEVAWTSATLTGPALGWLLHHEGLKRGLIFRHLSPLLMSTPNSAAESLIGPRAAVRGVPATAIQAAADFEQAAQGDRSAHDRLLDHLLRIGRRTNTTHSFLRSALARMRQAGPAPLACPEGLALPPWPENWSLESAPFVSEPLATMLTVGQKLAFAQRVAQAPR
jgi:hypothetical protein